jgi:hypothetical protein
LRWRGIIAAERRSAGPTRFHFARTPNRTWIELPLQLKISDRGVRQVKLEVNVLALLLRGLAVGESTHCATAIPFLRNAPDAPGAFAVRQIRAV